MFALNATVAMPATINESTVTIAQAEAVLRPLLRANNDATWKLTVQAYQQCVLGKVFPPEDPFRHAWISPGGVYRGQWIWDTTFVMDLLAVIPSQRDVLRGVFANYRDAQKRWDAAKPPYAHGMIPCMIEPGSAKWLEYPAYSQIPILAWGLERVYEHNHDVELVRQNISALEKFHEWYWRERDITSSGLVAVGSYSGVIQHARFETFDLECNLDDLKLTPNSSRSPGTENGNWYGDICIPGITAYLIIGEQSLARMAELVGDTEMAQRRRARCKKSAAAMQRYMWDETSGTYLAVRRDTLEKVRIQTIGSWLPLLAEVPTKKQAKQMAQMLRSSDWLTTLPIPTVNRTSPLFSGEFWRGDVWPPTNYQVACGLAKYGYHDLAAVICDRTIRNAIAYGINERYHPDTGKPLGVSNLGMSATVVTMMLDGLSSSKYRVHILAPGSKHGRSHTRSRN
ncbi:MAG: MGH1-like glycoside hydrolase domain-containing protein [Candidatus Sumerlaeaceae bacterium]